LPLLRLAAPANAASLCSAGTCGGRGATSISSHGGAVPLTDWPPNRLLSLLFLLRWRRRKEFGMMGAHNLFHAARTRCPFCLLICKFMYIEKIVNEGNR
jgi:hypothetical protein